MTGWGIIQAGMTASLAGEPDEHALGQPWANWLWLMEGSARSSLLVLGSAHRIGVVADRFSKVCESPALGGEIGYPDEAFDAIIAHDTIGATSLESRSRWWVQLHRVLRVGGTLYMDGSNPAWFRSLLRSGRVTGFRRLRQTTRNLRAGGFRNVSTYFLEFPPPNIPRVIIPGHRNAVLAWERFAAPASARRLGRVFLATVGLPELLYPAAAVLAQK